MAMSDSVRTFSTVEEELAYLRQRNRDYAVLEKEYADYIDQSKELEEKLEDDVAAKKKMVAKLQEQMGDLKEDHLEKQRESQAMIQSLEVS